MSDIIANAQKLLDGSTPAPWEWFGYSLESEHGMVLDFQCVTEFGMNGATREVDVTQEDEHLIAAAPELAQALAEETYEYAVQVKIGAKWLFLGRGTGGHNFARNAFWFVKKENAQDYMVIGKDMSAPARIVRRRVSPPEVINE